MSRGRRTGEAARARAADDPAITELLDTVREVRTTLAIDLSAAAGALEDSETRVARDILSATSDDLARLTSEVRDAGDDEVTSRRRSRRTRALLALPAVPLVGALAMTTAAALSSSPSTPPHHAVAPAASASPAHHASASTALQRLEDVVTHHAKAQQVIKVADDLHKQLTRMIATSTNDPAQLHVVRKLLTLEQHVLEGSKLPGTQLALAASRAIAALLEHRPATPQPKQSVASRETSHPTRATSTPRPRPSQTQVRRTPQAQQPESATHASPSPKRSNPLYGDGFFNWP